MTNPKVRAVAKAAITLAMLAALAGCGLLPTAEETTTEPDEIVTENPINDDQGQESDPATDQSAALEAYVAAGQAEITGLVEAFASTYSNITYTAIQPDTVEYAYTYLEPIDVAYATAALDEQIPMLQGVCDDSLFPIMELAGVTMDPKVRYTYYNPDGSLIWSHTFEKS